MGVGISLTRGCGAPEGRCPAVSSPASRCCVSGRPGSCRRSRCDAGPRCHPGRGSKVSQRSTSSPLLSLDVVHDAKRCPSFREWKNNISTQSVGLSHHILVIMIVFTKCTLFKKGPLINIWPRTALHSTPKHLFETKLTASQHLPTKHNKT